MKKLIIPDIHNKYKIVDEEILCHANDGAIYLGDYFDDFNDTVEDIRNMAIWLKEHLKDSKDIFLMGNHDIPYRFPKLMGYRCSGFTQEKCEAINSILTKEDWDKIKLCHFEGNYLFSHAGVCLECFGDPLKTTIEIEKIEEICHSALSSAVWKKHSMQLMAGRARGGSQMKGGITWLDWNDEFEAVEGLNQIVGHTPHIKPVMYQGTNSNNCALDTHLKHFGWLEDGVFSYQQVEIPPKNDIKIVPAS